MFMPTVFHENLFDDLFDPFWNEGALERAMNREARDTFGKRGANMMKTDVKQTDNGYEVDVDLPGCKKEDETGFTFAYDADYLASDGAEAVSLTLPLSDKPYHDTVLFPFFDGLIPEGWLLNIAESSWKINQRDRMSLLLACCKDCIGAVSVIPAEEPLVEETNS